MPNNGLGKLESVPLRSVWNNEARDFTPWLADPTNLRLLGETLGLDLETEEQEATVGPFAVDILCKNSADGSWVVIENQIERTDHSHLGQVLTYAAGLDAKTLIWVAGKFTEEHRAALDWLNENTAEGLAIFGVEIELWRIGDSAPAPKFNVVSKPNDWSRGVREGAGRVTELRQLQLNFWTAFRSWLEERSSIRPQKASPQHWMSASIGRAGFHLNCIVSTWSSVDNRAEPEIRVQLVIASPKSTEQFEALLAKRAELEAAIGAPLTWHRSEGNRQHRVYVRTPADFRQTNEWPEQFEWLRKYLEAFHRVFGPIVRTL